MRPIVLSAALARLDAGETQADILVSCSEGIIARKDGDQSSE
jgi:hypothetical protein